MDFFLVLGTQEIPLRQGNCILGRGADCEVRVDSALVSRQHASITVDRSRVTIQDLSSRNGVFVNEVLIRRTVPLEVGDEIRIGDKRLKLRARDRRASERRATLAQLPAVGRSPTAVSAAARTSAPARAIATPNPKQALPRTDAIDLLGSIVDRAIAAGDVRETETLVSGHLAMLLGEARAQQTLKADSCAAASRQALKLAASAQKASWVDYVFELYLSARQPMPLDIVHELFATVSQVRITRRTPLQRYLAFLRTRSMKPEDELVIQRLERFERL